MSTPAGWYPDANGVVRWWDGYRWTDAVQPALPPQVQPPAAYAQAAPTAYGAPPAPPATVAPGTSTNTVWVWLIVSMPVVLYALILVYFVQLQQSMTVLIDQLPMDPAQADVDVPTRWSAEMFAVIFSPWYILVVVLSLPVYGLSVWFGYLDSKELVRRGFEKPFHWAWVFLSTLVYVIGRAVVIRRRGGSGNAPMWFCIATAVAYFVGSLIWAIAFSADLMQHMMSQIPPG